MAAYPSVVPAAVGLLACLMRCSGRLAAARISTAALAVFR
jgi:hypothetical protein